MFFSGVNAKKTKGTTRRSSSAEEKEECSKVKQKKRRMKNRVFVSFKLVSLELRSHRHFEEDENDDDSYLMTHNMSRQ